MRSWWWVLSVALCACGDNRLPGSAGADADAGIADVADAGIDAGPTPPVCGLSAVGPIFGPADRATAGPRRVDTLAGGTVGSADGVGLAAQFNQPEGLTMAEDGQLYASECRNHAIRRIDPTSFAVELVAGTIGERGDRDGIGPDSSFNCPTDILAAFGSLWVADSFNHTIRTVDPSTGDVATVCGQPGSAGLRDGACGQARFNIPMGLATDGTRIFVADSNNHVLRSLDPSSLEVTTIAGGPGQPGFVDGDCAGARFRLPRGIASDGLHVFVADGGTDSIRVLDIATGQVTTLAGAPAGPFAYQDGVGEAARFFGPVTVATDGSVVFVSDRNNRALRLIDVETAEVTTIAGQPGASAPVDGVGANARFQWPGGMALSGDDLYVLDSFANSVRLATPDGL